MFSHNFRFDFVEVCFVYLRLFMAYTYPEGIHHKGRKAEQRQALIFQIT